MGQLGAAFPLLTSVRGQLFNSNHKAPASKELRSDNKSRGRMVFAFSVLFGHVVLFSRVFWHS